MRNATVFVGENATLLCKAYSGSMPHFQWLRWFPKHSNSSGDSTEGSEFQYEVIGQTQQRDLLANNNNHKFHEFSLTLDNVSKKSEGKYSCIVGNALGYAVENAYIIVHEKIGKWLPIIVIMEKKKIVQQAKLNLSNPSLAAIQCPTGLAPSCEFSNGFSLKTNRITS